MGRAAANTRCSQFAHGLKPARSCQPQSFFGGIDAALSPPFEVFWPGPAAGRPPSLLGFDHAAKPVVRAPIDGSARKAAHKAKLPRAAGALAAGLDEPSCAALTGALLERIELAALRRRCGQRTFCRQLDGLLVAFGPPLGRTLQLRPVPGSPSVVRHCRSVHVGC